MTLANFKREPIRSKAIRRAAADQRCTLNLPGICSHDEQTVVLCHVHDESFGKSQKADDTSGFFGCYACHTAYDLHRTGLEEADLLRLVIRAMQRTLRRLVLLGIVQIPEDAPKPLHERPVKPRKPRSQRKAVGPSRPMQSRNEWPPGRKIPSRATTEVT